MKLLFIIKNKESKRQRIVDMSDYKLIECVDIFRFWKMLDRFETKVKLVDERSVLLKALEIQNKQEKMALSTLDFVCNELLNQKGKYE